MVGDEIFQVKDFLIHPYPRIRSAKLPIDQDVFNDQLSRAMDIMKKCFRILAARWRLFRKLISADKKILLVSY